MAPTEPTPEPPKAFISYSWDDDAHKEWVKELAIRLRKDGVNATLDRWGSGPGDQIPEFMERGIRESDFVIAICTPRFQERFDGRAGGVGYEGNVMTAFALSGRHKKTFIPVLRSGSWDEVAPTFLLGTAKVDLSGEPYSKSEYKALLRTLHDAREKAPPIGPRPDFDDEEASRATPTPEPETSPRGVDARATPAPAEPGPIKPGQSWPPDWYQAEKKVYVPRPGLERQVVDLFRRQAGSRIVTLKAEGGMGKTRLAIECAGQMRDLFPDGVHFASLAATLPGEEAVAEAIGRALGLPAQECLPATVLERLKGRTTLLVLDNYESVDDPDGKVGRYLIRLVTEAHGLRLLVTGRSAVEAKGLEWIIDLGDGMTPEEARALFLDQAQHNWGTARDLTASEEPQWARILELTARIPLAIELAAGWAGHLSLKEIADGLAATPLGRLAGLPPGAIPSEGVDGRQDSLTRSLDWSYHLLAEPVQAIFATCGLFADSFDEPTVAAVAGVPQVQDDLIRLTNASLIRRREADDGSNRYRLHRFTREYALGRLDEAPAVAEETRRRFIARYARLAEENARDPNDLGRYAVLDQEWRNVLAAFEVARSLQDTPSRYSMFSLGDFLKFRGLWSETEFLYHQVLAIARTANDKNAEGVILNNMGIVYQARGRYGEALDAYAQSLDIKREFKDRVGEGNTLNNMGGLHQIQGRYDEALDAYARALDIQREFKDRVGEGKTLNNMGVVYQARGRYGEALGAYAQSLDIQREFKDRVGEGNTLNNMGGLHQIQGRYDEALGAYAQSLDIKREFKDRVGEGQTLNNMGVVYEVRGRYGEALDAYARALDIRREFKDRVGEGTTLNNMGGLHQIQGRYDEALDAYARALDIQREFKDRVGEGKTLNNMGIVYQARGRYGEALDAYAQSLDIKREFKDRIGEGQTLGNLALLAEARGDLTEAIRQARQAVAVLEPTQATMDLEKARRILNRLEKEAPGSGDEAMGRESASIPRRSRWSAFFRSLWPGVSR